MEEQQKAVFIDTNLDTHLIMDVPEHGTIADVREKILSAHLKIFPDSGQINVHALKINPVSDEENRCFIVDVSTSVEEQNEIDMDCKQVDTCHNSNLLEANGNVEVAETTVLPSTEHVSTDPHETVHNVDSSGKSEKGETILFPKDGKEVPKTETVDTCLLAADNVIRNPSNDGKSRKRKKFKRKRSLASKSRPRKTSITKSGDKCDTIEVNINTTTN